MPAFPDLVGLVVRDMAAALRFYRLLGMPIPDDTEKEDHVEVTGPNGLRVAWDTLALIKSFNPDWVENPTGNRIGLAFKCDSSAEVDALHAKIVAAGYHSHKAPWDAFWGQRYAVVVDPDGNLIDLFAAL
jgi:catechol 2,3-dioxygenase-like lactoylglutathione lyase family enzyme